MRRRTVKSGRGEIADAVKEKRGVEKMDPEIRTIDKAAAAGIIAAGKPAGLWMCMSEAFPKLWTGIDSRPGHLTLKQHGTFPEVLNWLMVRAGIMPKKGVAENRIRTGEPEICIRKQSGAALRIEGAQVRPWEETEAPGKVTIPEGFALTEEERSVLAQMRPGWSGLKIAEELGLPRGKVGYILHRLRQMGAVLPPCRADTITARIAERDARILALAEKGMTGTQIAREMGIAQSVAARRIRQMKRDGRL